MFYRTSSPSSIPCVLYRLSNSKRKMIFRWRKPNQQVKKVSLTAPFWPWLIRFNCSNKEVVSYHFHCCNLTNFNLLIWNASIRNYRAFVSVKYDAHTHYKVSYTKSKIEFISRCDSVLFKRWAKSFVFNDYKSFPERVIKYQK